MAGPADPPVLITVATTGAEVSKEQHPTLPTTPEEIADTAVRCEAAGAAMIHIHVRDDAGESTLAVDRVGEVVGLVRERTSLVVQVSTGGAVTDGFEDRLAVLKTQPDSCSLTMGTVNFGDDVFANPWGFITELYQATQELGIVPEFELFDIGHAHALRRLLAEYGPPAGGHVHVDFVMGVPGGMPGDARTLVAALAAMPPEVDSWSATGIGRATLPVMLAALSLGGHLRVGMEDVVTLRRGVPVQHNAELVERAVALSRLAQRSPMSGADARTFLNVAG